jgi:hypothetical protein
MEEVKKKILELETEYEIGYMKWICEANYFML